jgi:hypothetical protein
MDFNKGTVKGDMINVFRDYLFLLEFLENLGKNTCFNPTPHPDINGVPMAKLLGESPPFAAIFQDVEDAVQNLEVGIVNISTRMRKTVGDFLVLPSGNFHADKV